MSIGSEWQNSVKLKLSNTKTLLTKAQEDKSRTLLIPTGICNGVRRTFLLYAIRALASVAFQAKLMLSENHKYFSNEKLISQWLPANRNPEGDSTNFCTKILLDTKLKPNFVNHKVIIM